MARLVLDRGEHAGTLTQIEGGHFAAGQPTRYLPQSAPTPADIASGLAEALAKEMLHVRWKDLGAKRVQRLSQRHHFAMVGLQIHEAQRRQRLSRFLAVLLIRGR